MGRQRVDGLHLGEYKISNFGKGRPKTERPALFPSLKLVQVDTAAKAMGMTKRNLVRYFDGVIQHIGKSRFIMGRDLNAWIEKRYSRSAMGYSE